MSCFANGWESWHCHCYLGNTTIKETWYVWQNLLQLYHCKNILIVESLYVTLPWKEPLNSKFGWEASQFLFFQKTWWTAFMEKLAFSSLLCHCLWNVHCSSHPKLDFGFTHRTLSKCSLAPRPHPLMRRNSLVKLNFLGLCTLLQQCNLTTIKIFCGQPTQRRFGYSNVDEQVLLL